MTPTKPSQPWRLVVTTPGAPAYIKFRSKTAAYRAVQDHIERVGAGLSRATRITVEQWDVDTQRWTRYENAWVKGAS
ncbi:hypothetical protein ACIQPQ_31230 [Streptomyces sp. NPDC091281]|uniref:hypothetical protein n=1 Tax=Streptomyces sp. NPDC091281 TaxID=3365985 RepID=UPI003819B1C5